MSPRIRRKRSCVALAALVAASALGTGGTATAGPPATPAASFQPCGKVNIGFTDATLKASGVECDQARDVFRAFLRKSKGGCDGEPCIDVRVGRFRCHLGGTRAVARLNCVSGARIVRGIWGD